MKPSELRIGNFINFFGVYVPVISIMEDHVEVGYFNANINMQPTPRITHLEPIPLTPDLLVKCGFEKDILPPEAWSLKDIVIRKNTGSVVGMDIDEFYVHPYRYAIELKYLHQLQNLYFVLVGEELKIKL